MRNVFMTAGFLLLLPAGALAQASLNSTIADSAAIVARADFDSGLQPIGRHRGASRALKGALIGAAVGAATAVALDYRLRDCGSCDSFSARDTVFFGVLGAAIGAWIGEASGGGSPGTGHPFSKRRRVDATPLISPRAGGARVFVRF